MTWFANLKLNTKFNLILSALLLVLFLLTVFLAYLKSARRGSFRVFEA